MTVTTVIPALNEEGNVGRLIHETFRVVPREMLNAVIVVDGRSSDHTGDEIMFGQFFGLFVYARNIYLIWLHKRLQNRNAALSVAE